MNKKNCDCKLSPEMYLQQKSRLARARCDGQSVSRSVNDITPDLFALCCHLLHKTARRTYINSNILNAH